MDKTFTYQNRSEALNRLEKDQFDLVIIGGGITGAGIAVQAAASGMKTALIEMQDFAEGTSSRTTKLVHGGIRYLKQFDIDVVEETVKERAIVQQIAPHIPQPEKILLPLYDEQNPTFNENQLRAAMNLYDRLAGVEDEAYTNKMLTKEEMLALQPDLSQEDLLGGGMYLDFNNNDSRLVIENIKRAVSDGTIAVSRLRATDFEYEGDTIVAVNARDVLGGATVKIKTHLVINATGPWSDDIRSFDRKSENGPRMRPTKGVHLVVDREKLSLNYPLYVDTGENDGRMIFIISRQDKTYFGTTDTDYKGDFQNPKVEQEEVDYLLNIINRRFPNAQLTLDDIEASWAGIRPLIDKNAASDYSDFDSGRMATEDFEELASVFRAYFNEEISRFEAEQGIHKIDFSIENKEDTSSVSRGSDLIQSRSGLITLSGGKLTDYRKMAATAMTLIAEELPRKTKRKYQLIDSQTYPVSGGELNSQDVEQEIQRLSQTAVKAGLSEKEALDLAWLYGSNLPDVLQLKEAAESYAEKYNYPLSNAVSVLYALEHEAVFSAVDYFERRTTYFLFKRDQMLLLMRPVLNTIQDYLGLSKEEAERQRQVLEEKLKQSNLEYLKRAR